MSLTLVGGWSCRNDQAQTPKFALLLPVRRGEGAVQGRRAVVIAVAGKSIELDCGDRLTAVIRSVGLRQDSPLAWLRDR